MAQILSFHASKVAKNVVSIRSESLLLNRMFFLITNDLLRIKLYKYKFAKNMCNLTDCCFREGPGQEYPKPASVYEEFDDRGRSERCI
jgi:hypothetical protein